MALIRTVVGEVGGGGAGSLNIPLMVSCVPIFRLLHSNILCSVSQFRLLTVPFSGTNCLPPFDLTPPVPLSYAASVTSKLVLLTTLLCGTRNLFLYNVVLALCFSCYSLAVAYFIQGSCRDSQ